MFGLLRRRCHVVDGGLDLGEQVVLHAEQGFGDAIQFARYVPLLLFGIGMVLLAHISTLGADVTLVAPPTLPYSIPPKPNRPSQ